MTVTHAWCLSPECGSQAMPVEGQYPHYLDVRAMSGLPPIAAMVLQCTI